MALDNVFVPAAQQAGDYWNQTVGQVKAPLPSAFGPMQVDASAYAPIKTGTPWDILLQGLAQSDYKQALAQAEQNKADYAAKQAQYEQDLARAKFGLEQGVATQKAEAEIAAKRQTEEKQYQQRQAVAESVIPLLGKQVGYDDTQIAQAMNAYIAGGVDINELFPKKGGSSPAEIAAAVAAATRPGGEQEGTFGKELAKENVQQYIKTKQAGAAASQTIASLDNLSNLLTGVETGSLTPLGTSLAGYAESLGITVDPNLSRKQAVEAISNKMALQLRNTANGEGMPGSLSDSDRNFLVATVPGLAKTAEGNRILIDTYRKVAERQVALSRMATKYVKENNGYEGFDDIATQYNLDNPLFPKSNTTASSVISAADEILKKGKQR